MLYRRKRYREFEGLINENLNDDKFSILDNLLIAFYLEKVQKKLARSKKYKNVA